VKIVTANGIWRWVQAKSGIRGRFLKIPPVHIYQTIARFKTKAPPRGKDTKGFFIDSPFIFDIDLISKTNPINLWTILDGIHYIDELLDFLNNRGQYKIVRVIFSGFRGLHIIVQSEQDSNACPHIVRIPSKEFKSIRLERYQLSRTIGFWFPLWDWRVSADIWRVSRVPWSIHGKSALRAIIFKPPYSMKHIREQLRLASPFSFSRKLRVRITRPIPLFTFIDGETYGPYRKGWALRLPIAVALHLIWQDGAKPRESGPISSGRWFETGWQIIFQKGCYQDLIESKQEGDGS
jgi:hypothetical protein